MGEEEGRRDGSHFSAQGIAEDSGLAGTMPLPSPTPTPNCTHSKWGGAELRGVSGRVSTSSFSPAAAALC